MSPGCLFLETRPQSCFFSLAPSSFPCPPSPPPHFLPSETPLPEPLSANCRGGGLGLHSFHKVPSKGPDK